MTELRIWTARHTIRVTAPPKRVYEAVANVDRWPALVGTLNAVEHLGFDGACERVRFAKRVDGVDHDLTMVRELNPRRLRVRFRQVNVVPPVVSMGGIWLVLPKGTGSTVVIDHYYRVLDDCPVAAAGVEADLAEESTSMLAALRDAMEFHDLLGQTYR
ncbi:aromatase/cyclase [Actinophytocola oryzae]|uniref:Polyketide cyclase/dehydrase/lipid transport protein n=1 Tax=Actinophytocola oryzae TaxID=502181 RepID=A0A4R7VSS6_9PSEU|nr:aromatase/cyclase [Actinophytocola oryzae]TDV52267.1 polyketide cyclase/dehydrase/lipid transport protein [Actinophytocola oryzae]